MYAGPLILYNLLIHKPGPPQNIRKYTIRWAPSYPLLALGIIFLCIIQTRTISFFLFSQAIHTLLIVYIHVECNTYISAASYVVKQILVIKLGYISIQIVMHDVAVV